LAVQAVVVLAIDGVPELLWLLAGGPIVLVAAGLTLAYKSIPFEHVHFSEGRA